MNRVLHRWPDNPIVTHPANTRGRDLTIGALHGHFDTLEHALAPVQTGTPCLHRFARTGRGGRPWR